MNKWFKTSVLLFSTTLMLSACSDDNTNPSTPDTPTPEESDGAYVGKGVDGFTAEEWMPGGELGTTLNINSHCYEDNSPAVEKQGLNAQFQLEI